MDVGEKYPETSRVAGKVVSITDYGAFVELEEGIEGLVHVSQMSWARRTRHPSKIVNIGDTIEAVVLSVDKERKRISLGMKQIEPNPWDLVGERYAINSIVTGKVRNLTDFGAFIEVEEGVEGLVHISDLSWTKKVKHPSELLKKGDEVSAVVLSVDAENQRLSLGIKQLEPDKWEEFFSQHQVGDVISGKIVRLTSFGAFSSRRSCWGRVWRITYPANPLLKQPKIAGEPSPVLLNLLKEYENTTRHFARRELQQRNPDEVIPALEKWVAALDPADARHERLLLEALWIYQGLEVV